MTTRALAVLVIAVRAILLPDAGAAQQSAEWGEVTDGLQVSLSTGVNTESLTETRSLLYLTVLIRNVSDTPVPVKLLEGTTYDFEYEIDGTWYAFERMVPVRTPLTVLHSSLGRDFRLLSIAPGSSQSTILTLPLAGRSSSLSAYAITPDGPGRRFEPTPGAHVVRVRPGRGALEGRQAPVSNAVTVLLRTRIQADRREQSISFTSSAETALRELRFASGPADGQAFVRDVIARPPNPAVVAGLITSAALEVLEPIPVYEVALPRRANAPNAALPTATDAHHYLVRASDQPIAIIGLASSPVGSVLNWVGGESAAAPVFAALQQLAGMEDVRGGNYEPRLARVIGVRGTRPVLVFWLRSSSGRPDLFYRPRDPEFRGWTAVEIETLYTTEAFLRVARTLPVAPRYDESWAITTATACAKSVTGSTRTLIYEKAQAEIGLSEKGDRSVWYVHFPEHLPAGIIRTHSGAAFYVDEATGTCRPAMLGG